jgi:poly(3-hydroxybutyrate) depolymerase
LKLTGGAAATACASLLAVPCREKAIIVGEAGEALEGQREAGSAASQGRLLARPARLPLGSTARKGLRPLGLGSGRNDLIYVPAGYRPTEEAPLVLMLHGAGGYAQSGGSTLPARMSCWRAFG